MGGTDIEKNISSLVLKKAFEIGREIEAKALFVYADVYPEFRGLEEEKEVFDIYLVAKTEERFKEADEIVGQVLLVPDIPLSRMDQIKVAIMMAISKNLIEMGDKVVCLSGLPDFGFLDTLVVLEIGKEFEMLTSKRIIDFTKEIEPKVFEEVVRIAVEIANEGREGKPVGTCFIIGDSQEVKKYTEQMVINPFKGYPDEEKNVLKYSLRDTIKEFSQLDGAFVIRGDGMIKTAGAFIKTDVVPEKLPQGWGSRHYSAAAITNVTSAIAVTVSQTSGDVRIFKGGYSIMEIEKPLWQ